MNTTAALKMARPAGQGAGAVRPQRGFARHGALFPSLGSAGAGQQPEPFSPLTERAMGLYAIVDSAEWVERLLAAGVRTLQLRIKTDTPAPPETSPDSQLAQQVQRSVVACRRAQAQLFINDHWQLALQYGAYGVHLGQQDLAIADLHALRRAGIRVGVSTHSYWEVCRAKWWSPSYIACGPIHATATKAMPWLPQGNANLAYWCRLLQEPVVAIGGMDANRAREAMRCGASAVAVLSGITHAGNPEQAVGLLQHAITAGARDEPCEAPEMARPTGNGRC